MRRLRIGILYALVVFLFACCSQEDMTNTQKPNLAKVSSYTVSIEEAQKDLESILADVDPQTRGASSRRTISSKYTYQVKTDANTRADGEETPSVHIFNFADNQGYAIMSGDKRIPSLLALTDSGHIDTTTVVDNPGLIAYLGCLESKIEEVIPNKRWEEGDTAYVEYGEWETVTLKPGLCKVKWDQNDPYNMYCPMKNGYPVYTGCVATATAQLMSVYKYPLSYNGYTFDWDNMIPTKNRNDEHIARLMVELGNKENLDMSYGGSDANPYQSGAYIDNIPRTLKNFNYTNGGEVIGFSSSKIENEIKAGYPVLIGGYATEIKHIKRILGIKVKTTYEHRDGHCWLCHGLLVRRQEVKHFVNDEYLGSSYRYENYLLYNWGWSGDNDGYFLSNVFDAYARHLPENTRAVMSDHLYNFQYATQAVINIRK
jgi:hypothetical protein